MEVEQDTAEEIAATETIKKSSTGEKIDDSEQVKDDSRKTNSKAAQTSEQNLSTREVVAEIDSEKTQDSSLLQQVTQVLGKESQCLNRSTMLT